MRVTETRRRACALNYFFFMQQPVAEEWYTRYRDALGSKASRHWKLNVCNWENPASRATDDFWPFAPVRRTGHID